MRFSSIVNLLAAGLPAFSQAYTCESTIAPKSSSHMSKGKNVHTGGGGGFTPGIVFNTGHKGVAYLRTDIGGLYKLNADDTWSPLTDFANDSTWYIEPIHITAKDCAYTGAGMTGVSMHWLQIPQMLKRFISLLECIRIASKYLYP